MTNRFSNAKLTIRQQRQNQKGVKNSRDKPKSVSVSDPGTASGSCTRTGDLNQLKAKTEN